MGMLGVWIGAGLGCCEGGSRALRDGTWTSGGRGGISPCGRGFGEASKLSVVVACREFEGGAEIFFAG